MMRVSVNEWHVGNAGGYLASLCFSDFILEVVNVTSFTLRDGDLDENLQMKVEAGILLLVLSVVANLVF